MSEAQPTPQPEPEIGNQDLWRQIFHDGHPVLAKKQRRYRMLPGTPRCKLCFAPFGGTGGWIARRIGLRPSNRNPRFCNACDKFIEQFPGGAEVPLSGEPVGDTVRIDGAEIPAYGRIHRLTAGQGITVPRGMQHRFWGEEAPVFVAEVSQCNDDRADNFFLEPIGRFSEIEEDEAPHRLLWNEGGGR